MKKIVNYFVLIIIVVFLVSCSNELPDYPNWYSGYFSGNIGCEHDTLVYKFEFEAKKSNSNAILKFAELNQEVELKLNKTHSNLIRFDVVKCKGKLSFYNDYTFDLIKLESDKVIFIQALPKLEDLCIHLGQVAKH